MCIRDRDTLFKLRDNAVRDDEQLYEYLHLADRQIDRCIDITERLLRLSLPPGHSPDLVSINSACLLYTSRPDPLQWL